METKTKNPFEPTGPGSAAHIERRRSSGCTCGTASPQVSPENTKPSRFSDPVRNNIVACIGEFVGTFLFLFMAFAGTQVANEVASNNPHDSSAVILISLSFGFSLMANVWAFYRVSGGLFNPVVTLALFLIGGLEWLRAILVVIAQFLGGLAAAGVVSALFPGPLKVATTLRPGTKVVQGLFLEMFLTAQLVFVIIMLASEKHRATYLAPVGIGIAFFVTELCGVSLTGGSLNPARSLGPAVVTTSFPSYSWIYWLGPAMGAVLAASFFALLRKMRYRECSPEPDWQEVRNEYIDHGPIRHHGRDVERDGDDTTENVETRRPVQAYNRMDVPITENTDRGAPSQGILNPKHRGNLDWMGAQPVKEPRRCSERSDATLIPGILTRDSGTSADAAIPPKVG